MAMQKGACSSAMMMPMRILQSCAPAPHRVAVAGRGPGVASSCSSLHWRLRMRGGQRVRDLCSSSFPAPTLKTSPVRYLDASIAPQTPLFSPPQTNFASATQHNRRIQLQPTARPHTQHHPAPPTAQHAQHARRAFSASSRQRCADCPPPPAPPSFTPRYPPVFKMSEEQSRDRSVYLKQSHDKIFENNRKWAEEQRAKNPAFFEKLSAGQAPEYLWIGCSDSRVPAEAITGLEPGDMFIHRNIANLVCSIDLNVMSVVNYAVRHLNVKHIIVCGHYGCGGVKAAMTPSDLGLLNPWLRNIRDVYRLHEAELDQLHGDARYDRLVELNVVEQCRNIVKTAAVQTKFSEGGFPVVHGWVFGFKDGLLKDLEVDCEAMMKDVRKIYDLTK